jgi:hypothetical protein
MAPNEYEQRIVNDVAEHGWFCTSVVDDNPGASFSYSVGFGATLNAPECIIFGLPSKLTHSMLWRVFEQIKGGAVLSDGGRWAGLIEGFDCISRPVHPSQVTRDHFNSALWFWGDPAERGGSLQAYQLFWPGAKQGLFPWESGCDQPVRDYQPALYLPREIGLA